MGCKMIAGVSLVVGGLLLIGLGAGLGWGVFPDVVRSQVEENIDLTNPESEGYKNFMSPPVPVLIKFTFFNVTNPLEIVTKAEKPKFTEMGPYTYKETRSKTNLTFGEGTLDYAQYRRFDFDPENSCEGCQKTDTVRILNMPLIGAVAAALEQGNFLAGIVLRNLAGKIENTATSPDLFLVDTVDNIMFSGVRNDLVNLLLTDGSLNNKLPPAIQDNGFAIFNSKNDTTHNECYRVDTGVEKHSEILLWGADLDNLQTNLSTTRTCPTHLTGRPKPSCGSAFKPWWPSKDITGNTNISAHITPCNMISGTNAEQFPPFLEDRKDELLNIFTTDLCRSMSLSYLEDHDIDGIKTLRYSLPPGSTNVNKTANVCFCEELANKVGTAAGDCIKVIEGSDELDITECGIQTCYDGLQDIHRCMLSPVVMSSPHFYLAEGQLANFASGLTPNETLHRTVLDIEPVTGMVLSAHKRIQVNMPVVPTGMDQIVFLKDITAFPAFPVVWLDEGADIDQENIDKIKSLVTTPLLLLDVAKYAMIGLGSGLILVAAAVFLLC